MTAHRPCGQKEAMAVRREKVMALRVSGLSIRLIAEQVGCSGSTVRDDLKSELVKIAARTRENTEQLRALELERLEAPLPALYPKVLAGEETACEIWRKYSAERRKLLGLDAEGAIGGIIGKIRIVEFDLMPPAKQVASKIIEAPKAEVENAPS